MDYENKIIIIIIIIFTFQNFMYLIKIYIDTISDYMLMSLVLRLGPDAGVLPLGSAFRTKDP